MFMKKNKLGKIKCTSFYYSENICFIHFQNYVLCFKYFKRTHSISRNWFDALNFTKLDCYTYLTSNKK